MCLCIVTTLLCLCLTLLQLYISYVFLISTINIRFGDEYLSTGHWSESETSGTSATNAMDGRDPSSTRVFQYTRSTTHGTSSANAMDGRGSTISHSTTHERSNALSTTWTPGQHADTGNSAYEWAGAR